MVTVILQSICNKRASQGVLAVRNQPANAGDMIVSLGGEDSLEEVMATHSSIFAGNSPGQRNPAHYSPKCRKELNVTERLNTHIDPA